MRRRRLPARLVLGRCRRLRRPAAAALRGRGRGRAGGADRGAQVRRLPLGRSFWYVPHGPVMDYDHPKAAERLRAVAIGLREAARRDRAIAVKLEPRLERGSARPASFAKLRHEPRTLQVGQTRLVELADDETLMAGFDKDTRYAVRRAEREGVEITTVDRCRQPGGDRRAACAGARDAAPGRLPQAAAAALPARLAGPGQRRSRHASSRPDARASCWPAPCW